MTTIFGKIIDGELPCDKLYEDDDLIAFHDIAPTAPVHVLIVTKKPITSLQTMKEEDLPLMGKVVEVAQQLATALGIDEGYRLLTNNGVSAGQSVFHLHFHLIGGRQLGKLG